GGGPARGPGRRAGGGGAGEAAGIREQIEEHRSARFGPHPGARLPMVCEQPGIDVVVEVDEKSQIPLAHLDALAGACEPRILRPGAAYFQMHALGWYREGLGGSARDRFQPGDSARLLPGVLRHDEVAFIPVDRCPDFWNVPIVQPEGTDPLALEQRMQLAEALPYPVREHSRLLLQLHSPAAQRSIWSRIAPG